jgi:hypothetical protein
MYESFNIPHDPFPGDSFALVNPALVFKVKDNLWIGSAPPVGDEVGRYFDCLALCAREYQPRDCFVSVKTVYAKLDDCGLPMTSQEVNEAVHAAIQVIDWLSKGLQVLVTCFAGRNRSGLVCALALMYGPGKLTANQAIELIKSVRDQALTNSDFVTFLRSLDNHRALKARGSASSALVVP